VDAKGLVRGEGVCVLVNYELYFVRALARKILNYFRLKWLFGGH